MPKSSSVSLCGGSWLTLAIMIIVFTFLFLFGRFNREDHVHHSRVIIWETVHFPLHFFLLLLLAGLVVSAIRVGRRDLTAGLELYRHVVF